MIVPLGRMDKRKTHHGASPGLQLPPKFYQPKIEKSVLLAETVNKLIPTFISTSIPNANTFEVHEWDLHIEIEKQRQNSSSPEMTIKLNCQIPFQLLQPSLFLIHLVYP